MKRIVLNQLMAYSCAMLMPLHAYAANHNASSLDTSARDSSAQSTQQVSSIQSLAHFLRSVLDHPSIIARENQTLAAEEHINAAKYQRVGRGELYATYTHLDSPQFAGPFTQHAFMQPPFADNQLQYGIQYSIPLDLAGIVRANLAKARTNHELAFLAQRQEQLLNLHKALTAWVNIQVISEKHNALKLEQQRLQLSTKRVNAEVKAGLLGLPDLTLVQSELAKIDADMIQNKSEMNKWNAEVQNLAGYQVNVQVPHNGIHRIPLLNIKKDEDPATLQDQMASAQLQVAQEEALIAKRSLYPAVTANLGYTRYNAADLNDSSWFVGAKASMPLDLGLWSRAKASTSQLHAAQANERAIQLNVTRQMVHLENDYVTAKAQLAALQKELVYRETMVSYHKQLVKVGSLTTEDELKQQRALLDVKTRIADAKAQAIITWSAYQVLYGIAPQDYIAAAAEAGV